MQVFRLQFFKTSNFFTVIFGKFCPQLFPQLRELGTNVAFFQSYIIEFVQINADRVSLSTDKHIRFSQGLATMCVNSI